MEYWSVDDNADSQHSIDLVLIHSTLMLEEDEHSISLIRTTAFLLSRLTDHTSVVRSSLFISLRAVRSRLSFLFFSFSDRMNL